MLDKLDPDFIGKVAAAIGWLAFAFITVRAGIRYMAGTATTREDRDLAETLNRDILKVIAEQTKEQTETLHSMTTKQAVLETRLRAVELELKERR